MAEKSFRLPDIGEGTAEAELAAWHVEIGQMVKEDQPLCDVMTDKATVEVTAPFGGTVVRRTGELGDMLPVGGVILVFDVDGNAEVSTSMTEVADDRAAPAVPMAATASALEQPSRRVLASPAVRARAIESGVDLRNVVGSGAGGRIRQSDVDAFLAYRPTTGHAPAAAQAVRLPMPSSPSAPSSDSSSDGIDEIPVMGLRRRIAERMQDTKRRIPHFSYIEEVNVSQLERLRETLNATRHEDAPKLTILPFIVHALTRALPEFPQMNALYDDAAGVVRRYAAVHAGIATQTLQGLVVTVLKDAARHDLWGVAGELSRLSSLARAGRAAPVDLTGSTITITSLGAMGGVATTPVINSPEVAIVGLNKIVERPIVEHGQICVAKMMNISSSFDHRVIDGWDAALFVQRLKALLETPALLFVDL